MLKKLLAGVAVATVLAVGGVAVAGAVSSPPPTKAGHSHRSAAGNLVAVAIKTAASTIGVDVKTLRAGVQSGQTIAQIAQQHHVSPSAVVQAVITKVDAAIDAATKAGTLSSSRAAKARSRVPALADRLVNHTSSVMRRLRKGAHEKYHVDKVLQAAASAIGISYDSLRQAMHAGQTIGEIAKAHGVSEAKVAAAMSAVAESQFGTEAASTRSHKMNLHYRNAIPTIMQRWVNGALGLRHAAHRGVRAKARATG